MTNLEASSWPILRTMWNSSRIGTKLTATIVYKALYHAVQFSEWLSFWHRISPAMLRRAIYALPNAV